MKKMTMKKTTLLASGFAMLVSASMLIGTTYAWFTDSAQVTVNKIVVGTLDVAIVGEDGKEVSKLSFAEDAKWEPGGTYSLPPIKVKNIGELTLKYQVVVSGLDGDATLKDMIEWKINGTEQNTAYPLSVGAESGEIVISGTMSPNAGNDCMGKTLEGVTITVYATQNQTNAKFEEIKQPDNITANVGTVEELKSIIQTAMTGGSANGVITINLTQDFDVDGKWGDIVGSNYEGVNTVVLNGKKADGSNAVITNLNAPLFPSKFAGNGTLTINDLTIEGARIENNTSKLGVGAFVGNVDESGAVELNNCHLIKSTITCTAGYAAGLVGYISGDNVSTVKGCSVTDCTIKGANSTGAVYGHAAAPIAISSCKASGNTIALVANAAGGENKTGWRIGVLVGTVQKTATFTGITNDGNKLSQYDNATKPDGQSDLYGRIAGGSATLDGQSI